MLQVTPLSKEGRAEILLRNGGKSAIRVNVLMWPESRERPAIQDLLSGQHLQPKTSRLADITDAVLSMIGAADRDGVVLWMVFEIDPDCQRFPVRYEVDIHLGRITRFAEQYPR